MHVILLIRLAVDSWTYRHVFSVRDIYDRYKDTFIGAGADSEDTPCLHTLYLHFIPSNETNAAAGRYFGDLNVKRGLTSSTGRNTNPDIHYNAKLWQIVKTKSVKVRKGTDEVTEKSGVQ